MLSAAKVRIHGMQDENWVIKDKINQYRGLIKLYERDRKIHEGDLAKQKKRYSRDIRTLRKEISTKRGELGVAVYGDKQFLRNAFQEHRRLQLTYMNSQADVDHATKFSFLRPLTSKRAAEVAIELLKIFLEVGCPYILQSDNDREFTAAIIQELTALWPTCKIINGRPRHPASQGKVERANQDVEAMLRAWLIANDSKNWAIGCYFVQFQKNFSFHRTIKRSPYKALFGTEPKTGLQSAHIPTELLGKLVTEEELDQFFKQQNVSATESIDNNSKICEEQLTIESIENSTLALEPVVPGTSAIPLEPEAPNSTTLILEPVVPGTSAIPPEPEAPKILH
ncbi:hypothetical protein evm_012805 [Chilo suppressalis]|nr:hypothetical protein evm_012805 [Chilo suppressalis]